MPYDKTYNKIYHEGLGQWIGIKTKKGTRLLEQMINSLYMGGGGLSKTKNDIVSERRGYLTTIIQDGGAAPVPPPSRLIFMDEIADAWWPSAAGPPGNLDTIMYMFTIELLDLYYGDIIDRKLATIAAAGGTAATAKDDFKLEFGVLLGPKNYINSLISDVGAGGAVVTSPEVIINIKLLALQTYIRYYDKDDATGTFEKRWIYIALLDYLVDHIHDFKGPRPLGKKRIKYSEGLVDILKDRGLKDSDEVFVLGLPYIEDFIKRCEGARAKNETVIFSFCKFNAGGSVQTVIGTPSAVIARLVALRIIPSIHIKTILWNDLFTLKIGAAEAFGRLRAFFLLCLNRQTPDENIVLNWIEDNIEREGNTYKAHWSIDEDAIAASSLADDAVWTTITTKIEKTFKRFKSFDDGMAQDERINISGLLGDIFRAVDIKEPYGIVLTGLPNVIDSGTISAKVVKYQSSEISTAPSGVGRHLVYKMNFPIKGVPGNWISKRSIKPIVLRYIKIDITTKAQTDALPSAGGAAAPGWLKSGKLIQVYWVYDNKSDNLGYIDDSNLNVNNIFEGNKFLTMLSNIPPSKSDLKRKVFAEFSIAAAGLLSPSLKVIKNIVWNMFQVGGMMDKTIRAVLMDLKKIGDWLQVDYSYYKNIGFRTEDRLCVAYALLCNVATVNRYNYDKDVHKGAFMNLASDAFEHARTLHDDLAMPLAAGITVFGGDGRWQRGGRRRPPQNSATSVVGSAAEMLAAQSLETKSPNKLKPKQMGLPKTPLAEEKSDYTVGSKSIVPFISNPVVAPVISSSFLKNSSYVQSTWFNSISSMVGTLYNNEYTFLFNSLSEEVLSTQGGGAGVSAASPSSWYNMLRNDLLKAPLVSVSVRGAQGEWGFLNGEYVWNSGGGYWDSGFHNYIFNTPVASGLMWCIGPNIAWQPVALSAGAPPVAKPWVTAVGNSSTLPIGAYDAITKRDANTFRWVLPPSSPQTPPAATNIVVFSSNLELLVAWNNVRQKNYQLRLDVRILERQLLQGLDEMTAIEEKAARDPALQGVAKRTRSQFATGEARLTHYAEQRVEKYFTISREQENIKYKKNLVGLLTILQEAVESGIKIKSAVAHGVSPPAGTPPTSLLFTHESISWPPAGASASSDFNSGDMVIYENVIYGSDDMSYIKTEVCYVTTVVPYTTAGLVRMELMSAINLTKINPPITRNAAGISQEPVHIIRKIEVVTWDLKEKNMEVIFNAIKERAGWDDMAGKIESAAAFIPSYPKVEESDEARATYTEEVTTADGWVVPLPKNSLTGGSRFRHLGGGIRWNSIAFAKKFSALLAKSIAAREALKRLTLVKKLFVKTLKLNKLKPKAKASTFKEGIKWRVINEKNSIDFYVRFPNELVIGKAEESAKKLSTMTLSLEVSYEGMFVFPVQPPDVSAILIAAAAAHGLLLTSAGSSTYQTFGDVAGSTIKSTFPQKMLLAISATLSAAAIKVNTAKTPAEKEKWNMSMTKLVGLWYDRMYIIDELYGTWELYNGLVGSVSGGAAVATAQAATAQITVIGPILDAITKSLPSEQSCNKYINTLKFPHISNLKTSYGINKTVVVADLKKNELIKKMEVLTNKLSVHTPGSSFASALSGAVSSLPTTIAAAAVGSWKMLYDSCRDLVTDGGGVSTNQVIKFLENSIIDNIVGELSRYYNGVTADPSTSKKQIYLEFGEVEKWDWIDDGVPGVITGEAARPTTALVILKKKIAGSDIKKYKLAVQGGKWRMTIPRPQIKAIKISKTLQQALESLCAVVQNEFV